MITIAMMVIPALKIFARIRDSPVPIVPIPTLVRTIFAILHLNAQPLEMEGMEMAVLIPARVIATAPEIAIMQGIAQIAVPIHATIPGITGLRKNML